MMMVKEQAGDVAVRSALLVLGMHRSGTSAVSGVLAAMGCTAPLTQIQAGPQNPRGFFESRLVARLGDRILEASGSSWQDWRPLDLPAPASPQGIEFRDAAATLVEEEFCGTDLIVLKDPRICRLSEIWSDALARQGYRPALVLIHRDPYEVARSLWARNGFPLAFGLLLWLRYVLDAERDTRGRPRVFTSYDQVLADWRGVVGRIGDRLGVAFPRSLDAAGPEVDAFLSAELRHHATDGDEPTHPTLSALVRGALDILDRWATEGEDDRDHSALDRLNATLGEASWTYADASLATTTKVEQVRAELSVAKAEGAWHQGRLALAERLLATAQAALPDALASNRELTEDRDRQTQELGALARLLQETTEQLRDARARLLAAEEELHSVRKDWDEAEQRLRAVVESSSWRLTAPVRRVADKLRRGS